MPHYLNVTGGLNISGIISKILSPDFNFTKVKTAFKNIIHSIHVNTTMLINGISNIVKNITFNSTKVISELANIFGVNATKISKIIDAVKDIIKGIKINFTAIVSGIKTMFTNFSVNMSNILKEIKVIIGGISFNKTSFVSGLSIILEAFDISEWELFEKLSDFITYLELNFTDEMEQGIVDIITGKTTNITDIINLIKDIGDYNNLTASKIIAALYNVTGGFNITSIINKIKSPDFNITKVIVGLKDILQSFKINKTALYKGIVSIIKSFNFNMTNIIDGVHEIISAIKINTTSIMAGISKIVNEFKSDAISFIDMVIKNFVKEIKVNDTSIISGINKIVKSISINSTGVLDGLNKIVRGLGVNVSNMINQIVSKIGYHSTFAYVFAPGTYDISVKFLSDDRYSSATKTSNLMVLPNVNATIGASVLTPKKYGDKTKVDISLADGYGKPISGEVDLTLNGEKIANLTINETGKISYAINNLATGAYTLVINYGDLNKTVDFSVNVDKVATKIVYKNMKTVTVNVKVDGKIGKYFKVTLKDANGKVLSNKVVLIGYNGKTYKRTTDKNGVCKIQINLPKYGTYSIAACFLGDNIYSSSYITSKITVKKQTPKIKVKKKTYRAKAKIKKLTATFKSAKGKAVKGKLIKFRVKGKILKAKTNKKGVATVKVKLFKKGTYKVKVSFAGDTMYKKVNKKMTLRIK